MPFIDPITSYQTNFSPTHPPPIELDLDEAISFVQIWFDSPPYPLFAITELPGGDKRLTAAHPTTDQEIADFLRFHAQRGWNLYFGINRPLPTVRTTPTKAEITHFLGLHVDLDLPKPPSPYAHPTPENFERLTAILPRLTPRPTFTTFSGGGNQLLFHFPTPLVATSPLLTDVEAANRELETLLAADNCHNVNRLMRLPGTVNFPDARKRARGRLPSRAYLVSYDPSARFEFADRPTHSLAPPRRTDRPTDPNDTDLPDYDELPLDDDEIAGRTVSELSARLQRIVRFGDPTDWGGDRSRLVWYVVTNLVRLRWTDEEISSVLLNPTLGLYPHVAAQSDPRTYTARQITRARNTVRTEWERHRMTNAILTSSQINITRALDELGAKFSFNTFANRAYVNGAGPLRVIEDDTAIELRLSIDQRFNFLPDKDLLADVMRYLCRKGDYHPVRDYLKSLIWDGVPRLGRAAPADLFDSIQSDPQAYDPANPPFDPTDRGSPGWLTTYGQAEDSAYTRTVGRLALIAGVRRIRTPGCKFDEMLVLINPTQGTDKSTAIRILAKDILWFTDSLPLDASAKQVIEQLSGKWIVEASELTGMRKSDVERLKTFMAQQVDSDRLAYDRYRTEQPRQCVFIGTTNSLVFLKDDQNRRFWPVIVGRFDTTALGRDVDQLWAEAAHHEALGESIRLPRALWAVAGEHQADARASEPWAEVIGDVLGNLTGRIVNADVWKIIGKPTYNRTQDDNRRMGEAMRELGFTRRRLRVDGRVAITYARGDNPAQQRPLIYVYRDEIAGTCTASHDPADAALINDDSADFPGRPNPPTGHPTSLPFEEVPV